MLQEDQEEFQKILKDSRAFLGENLLKGSPLDQIRESPFTRKKNKSTLNFDKLNNKYTNQKKLEKKKFKIKRMMDSSALDESSDSEEKHKIASPNIEEEHSPFAMKLSNKDFS